MAASQQEVPHSNLTLIWLPIRVTNCVLVAPQLLSKKHLFSHYLAPIFSSLILNDSMVHTICVFTCVHTSLSSSTSFSPAGIVKWQLVVVVLLRRTRAHNFATSTALTNQNKIGQGAIIVGNSTLAWHRPLWTENELTVEKADNRL